MSKIICKHCGSKNLIKWGVTKYRNQMFKCKDCDRTTTIPSTKKIGVPAQTYESLESLAKRRKVTISKLLENFVDSFQNK